MMDVVVIDETPRIRQAVRELLEQHAVRVVGEADDGIAGLHLVLSLHPHVVVMALGIVGLDGIEATRRIKAAAPCITVIGLSVIMTTGSGEPCWWLVRLRCSPRIWP